MNLRYFENETDLKVTVGTTKFSIQKSSAFNLTPEISIL